ncbi:MAG: hypothetical protein ACREP6_06155 [Candidatus Binataceae bacterium]
MEQLSYSSLAAFLAHYDSLRRNPPDSGKERQILEEMEKLLSVLKPDERASLDSGRDGAARRRERAERILSRELAARGVLAG